jgi:hypothetical protein
VSTPEIDTRSAIEEAFEKFDIFLAAGVVVWSLEPADKSALITLNAVIDEFKNLKAEVLAA